MTAGTCLDVDLAGLLGAGMQPLVDLVSPLCSIDNAARALLTRCPTSTPLDPGPIGAQLSVLTASVPRCITLR